MSRTRQDGVKALSAGRVHAHAARMRNATVKARGRPHRCRFSVPILAGFPRCGALTRNPSHSAPVAHERKSPSRPGWRDSRCDGLGVLRARGPSSSSSPWLAGQDWASPSRSPSPSPHSWPYWLRPTARSSPRFPARVARTGRSDGRSRRCSPESLSPIRGGGRGRAADQPARCVAITETCLKEEDSQYSGRRDALVSLSTARCPHALVEAEGLGRSAQSTGFTHQWMGRSPRSRGGGVHAGTPVGAFVADPSGQCAQHMTAGSRAPRVRRARPHPSGGRTVGIGY